MDAKLAATINLLPVGDRDESHLCQVSGVMKVNNNAYELSQVNLQAKSKHSNIRPIMLGQIESQQHLIHHLSLGKVLNQTYKYNQIIFKWELKTPSLKRTK